MSKQSSPAKNETFDSPGLISAREAAGRKDCSRQAVYAALERGAINEQRTGGLRLVQVDEAFDSWQPRPYGEHRRDDE